MAVASSQPEDLYVRVQMEATRRATRVKEQEDLKECQRRAHASRKMKELEVEVEQLKMQASLKEDELKSLRDTLPPQR